MSRKILAAAAVVCAAACAYLVSCNKTVDPSAVRVGANLPLTGALETYGKSVREGAEMALEDLKSAGGAAPEVGHP